MYCGGGGGGRFDFSSSEAPIVCSGNSPPWKWYKWFYLSASARTTASATPNSPQEHLCLQGVPPQPDYPCSILLRRVQYFPPIRIRPIFTNPSSHILIALIINYFLPTSFSFQLLNGYMEYTGAFPLLNNAASAFWAGIYSSCIIPWTLILMKNKKRQNPRSINLPAY